MKRNNRDEVITCPSCGTQFTAKRHKRVRWMAAGAGAIVGGAATQSLLGGVILGALSYGLAAGIDEYYARRCPKCHTVAIRPRGKAEPMAPAEPMAAPPKGY